jgi:hypothetical protein
MSLLRWSLPLLITAFTSISIASPLAIDRDVDGDGVTDHIGVVQGKLRIVLAQSRFETAIKIDQDTELRAEMVAGKPTVMVLTTTESYVFQQTRRGWQLILNTPVGRQGLDGEYSIGLELRADGIYRFQTRADLRDCGGALARTYLERFNGQSFEPATSHVDASHFQVLNAVVSNSNRPTATIYRARTEVFNANASDASALVVPRELDDSDPSTFWSAGTRVIDGLAFTYRSFVEGAEAVRITLQTSRNKNARRPRSMILESREHAYRLVFDDKPPGTTFTVNLPEKLTGCLTLTLETSFGPKSQSFEMAELEVNSECDLLGTCERVLAETVGKGTRTASSAASQLRLMGPRGADGIGAELAIVSEPSARLRLLRTAMHIEDPRAWKLVADAIASDELRGSDLLDALKFIGGHGHGDACEHVFARADVDDAVRAAAITALSASEADDRQRLERLLGIGTFTTRRAVMRKLSELPTEDLIDMARAKLDARAASDLWESAILSARTEAQHAGLLQAMLVELPAAADYERRYRLISGIASLGSPTELAAVRDLIEREQDDAFRSAYKHAIAEAFAREPRAGEVAALVSLFQDADPGVRRAAISAALALIPTAPEEVSAQFDMIATQVLAKDRWPELRVSITTLLALRCHAGGVQDTLTASASTDPDPKVRVASLDSLAICRPQDLVRFLLRLADSSKTPLEVRVHAVSLLGSADNVSEAGSALLKRFERWHNAAIESEASLQLAVAAAYALGHLAPARARDVLMRALEDEAFPEVVAASADALALIGKPCPPLLAPRLAKLMTGDNQEVANAAARTRRVCGF